MKRAAWLAVVAVALAVPSSARGDAPGDDAAVAPATPDSLYRASGERYREGRFAEAADLLREAYKLAPDPVLLYNLGRACEGMGDLPCAIDAYKRYLSDASPPDRGSISQRVTTLERTQSDRLELEARRRDEAAAPTRAHAPDAPASSRGASLAPWLVIGAGAVGAVTGTALLAMGHSQHEDAVREPVQATAASLQDRAEAKTTAGAITLAAASATLAGGVLWEIWEVVQTRKNRAPQTSATVSVGPATVRVTVTF